VAFSETEDRSPVFELATFDSELGCGVDGVIAFIFLVPGCRGREAGIFGSVPLQALESDLAVRPGVTYLHRSSRVVSRFLLYLIHSSLLQFYVFGIPLDNPDYD
jgi:hypothetical protein